MITFAEILTLHPFAMSVRTLVLRTDDCAHESAMRLDTNKIVHSSIKNEEIKNQQQKHLKICSSENITLHQITVLVRTLVLRTGTCAPEPIRLGAKGRSFRVVSAKKNTTRNILFLEKTSEEIKPTKIIFARTY